MQTSKERIWKLEQIFPHLNRTATCTTEYTR